MTVAVSISGASGSPAASIFASPADQWSALSSPLNRKTRLIMRRAINRPRSVMAPSELVGGPDANIVGVLAAGLRDHRSGEEMDVGDADLEVLVDLPAGIEIDLAADVASVALVSPDERN